MGALAHHPTAQAQPFTHYLGLDRLFPDDLQQLGSELKTLLKGFRIPVETPMTLSGEAREKLTLTGPHPWLGAVAVNLNKREQWPDFMNWLRNACRVRIYSEESLLLADALDRNISGAWHHFRHLQQSDHSIRVSLFWDGQQLLPMAQSPIATYH